MSAQNEKPAGDRLADDQTSPNKDIANAAREKEKDDSQKQQGGEKKPDKKPPGGYDSTPIQHAPPGYTVKFTFHKATKLPMADLSTMSSDPYLYAQLRTALPARHKEDPVMHFRTPTVWKTTNPEWDEVWVVAHVPSSGFKLKVRVYDEDQGNQDDRLGNVHVNVGHIDENWSGIHNQAFKIKKRSGSWRAYALRAMAVCFREAKEMSGHLYISAEVLGKSDGSDGGRCYTIGHQHWSRHYSPLLGRIANRKEDSDNEDEPGQDNSEYHNNAQGSSRDAPAAAQKKKKSKAQRYNFQANQIQLRGPVPPELYHRFVEFRPLIGKLFRSKGLRGAIMHSALHHQHVQVYNYNKDTKYGGFDEPCDEMTRQFLDLVHYDTGGRIFTYVLTLDALMRFTETGKEFGIDMLSKHTMHSDASIYIAFSGEFFIRRRKHREQDQNQSQPHSQPQHVGNSNDHTNEKHDHLQVPSNTQDSSHRIDKPQSTNPKNKGRSASNASLAASTTSSQARKLSRNPADYEMFIDNDSGTYRPNAKLLPLLKKFLESNFPGLHVNTLDCQEDEERMKRLKDEQRQRKKDSGNLQVFRQTSRGSSISSSDESALDRAEADQDRNGDAAHQHQHSLGAATHALGQGSRPHVSNLFKQGGTGQ